MSLTLAEKKTALKSVDFPERWLLITLAVYNDTATLAAVARMMKRNGTKLDDGKDWTQARITTYLKRLHMLGMVNKLSASWRIDSAWMMATLVTGRLEDPKQFQKVLVDVYRERSLGGSSGGRYYYYRVNFDLLYEKARNLWLQNKSDAFIETVSELENSNYRYNYGEQQRALEKVNRCFWHFDAEFFSSYHPFFQELALTQQLFRYPLWEKETSQELGRYLREQLAVPGLSPRARKTMEQLALMVVGKVDQDRPLFASDYLGIRVLNHLLKGEIEAAQECYGEELEIGGFVSTIDVIHLIFFYSQEMINAKELYNYLKTFTSSQLPTPVNAIIAFGLYEKGDVLKGEKLLDELYNNAEHPIDWMVALWVNYWLGINPPERALTTLADGYQLSTFEQTPWLLGEILYTLSLLFPQHPKANNWAEKAGKIEAELGITYLVNLIKPREPWENTLRVLGLVADGKSGEVAEKDKQLIWIVDFDQQEVYPKEQKMGKKGWTSGRKLKYSELINYPEPSILAKEDHNSLSALSFSGRQVTPGNSYTEEYILVDFAQLLYQLVGHPRVFLDEKKRIPLELKQGVPELTVTENDGGLLLSFDPPMEGQGYVYKKETPTRYTIYRMDADQARMSRAIGAGVSLPQEHRGKLEEKLDRLRNKVSVLSSTDLLNSDLEEINGNPTPCVQLLPFGEAFKLEIYVKPLPEETYYFKPGNGLPRTVLVREEGRFICVRDLNQEETLARELIDACPTLAGLENHDFEWQLDDTHTALRVLLELRGLLEKQSITLEHPKGEKLKLVTEASSKDFDLSISKNRDWFEVKGKIKVDENRVVDFEFLLNHLREQESSFVQLENGDFIALTDELKDRVREMEGLLIQKGKKLQLSTLAAGRFAEVADGLADVEADEAWQDSLDRIKRARDLKPVVPADFRAELRDYQQTGFSWLMRLAEWGVGGCLADDMGLGKTVQALAMLVSRADKGPSLVIAPASVTRNWMRETERFAPGLIPILLPSRKEVDILQQLGNGDLLLVSYGLLPFVAEELQEVVFGSIVLDEAQAIKNSATKRAKTVQNLQGDFRLATTGTPIENNLGELWSLFRFINPGLLGSKEVFNTKFNRPIALYDDEQRRDQLRNLIKPFMLRRRKDDVLKELPSKTEVVLSVELSPEEMALYEAMRRQAIQEIADADEQSRRFTVLTQLTKLRQAACNPRLVRPRSKVKSAKLELVGETVKEILEGGHKALIFSQFVKHLKIVEDWVKSEGIAYQYLDGSTPGKKREESVNAFQNGEGDVFLISLKAGGTGLNLTAADYVLHLDPWWNPAAEDQASDRAHRIGQQRPVTVYRFVSENTIEEQILALHKDKRDLADQLLSGTSQANSLSVDDILKMISAN